MLRRAIPLVGGLRLPANQMAGLRLLSTKGKKGKKEEVTDQGAQWHVRLIDEYRKAQNMKVTFPPEVEAEHQRIAREYNKQTSSREHQIKKDLTMKIYLRDQAIAALPPQLQEHARTPDYTPFPDIRSMPGYTPPIKGFDPEQYMESERS